MAKPKALTKAAILSLGVALMLPVASSWQQMFGSVRSRIAVESALEEKERMEDEMKKMMEQMAKLEELIEKLEQGE